MKESEKKKRLPIGNEDFKKIIEKGYYYVDKTLFIKELLDNGSKVQDNLSKQGITAHCCPVRSITEKTIRRTSPVLFTEEVRLFAF